MTCHSENPTPTQAATKPQNPNDVELHRNELGSGAVEFALQAKTFAISMVVRPGAELLPATKTRVSMGFIHPSFYLNRLAPTRPLKLSRGSTRRSPYSA